MPQRSGKKTSKTTKTAAAAADKSLEAAVKKAIASIRALREELDGHGLASLTGDERQHSAGKLRDGEHAALAAVLDTVDAHPGLFASLAPRDHGVDDAVVETAPARAALARRALLAPLAAEIDALGQQVSDDVLASGERAKDVTTPAYAIIRAHAAIDPKLRKASAAALDFYARQARRRPARKPAGAGAAGG